MPAVEVPFIWSSNFLDHRAAELAQHQLTFGYQPSPHGKGPRPLRAAIFEPNVSVTKVCSIPMLICDQAYRRNPNAVAKMDVLNSVHMAKHMTLTFLANALNIVRDHKAVFIGRHDFAAYMAGNADLVVTHQWQHDMNYLYLDALYGAYPLIHNSPWLGSVGYFYPEFDIEAGGEQVLAAWAHHDENFVTYKADTTRFLATLSPLNNANQDHYGRRLLQLQATHSRRQFV